MQTVSVLRDSVSGQLQGLSLNNVVNLDTLFERTIRELLVLIDIPEAVAQQNFPIYDGVTDYEAPTTMFASGILDIRPQGITRTPDDQVIKMYGDQFDRTKGFINLGTKTTVEYNQGIGALRIVSNQPSPRLELDPMTATTGWVATGEATGLTTDQAIYWQSSSSLMFQVAGAGQATLAKTISQVDFTQYVGLGVAFMPIYVGNVANLTSVTLRIGTNASNYYTVTVSKGFLQNFTNAKWMMLAFDYSTATTVGAPTITDIAYVEVIVTASGSISNFHLGDLFISLPSPVTLIFSTQSLFLATNATTPSATITDITDEVLLNDAAFVIYETMCASNVAKQQGGTLASGVVAALDQKLNGLRGYRGILIQAGLLDLYRADNPSQELRTKGSYYSGLRG